MYTFIYYFLKSLAVTLGIFGGFIIFILIVALINKILKK